MLQNTDDFLVCWTSLKTSAVPLIILTVMNRRMPKKTEKRTALTPPLLSPPKHDYPSDIYETGARGGYPTHDIDWESFNEELNDLLGRYGGADFDTFRLRAHITDLTKEYHHQCMAVPTLTKTSTQKDIFHSIEAAQTNVKLATDQLRWVLTDMKYIKLDTEKVF
jgi:hypothetical protein